VSTDEISNYETEADQRGHELISVCPEHEHWQDRQHGNVIACSDTYAAYEQEQRLEAEGEEEGEGEGEDEGEGEGEGDGEALPNGNGHGNAVGGRNMDREKTLVERDVNVEAQRRAVKV
jgi:hypothetical protein